MIILSAQGGGPVGGDGPDGGTTTCGRGVSSGRTVSSTGPALGATGPVDEFCAAPGGGAPAGAPGVPGAAGFTDEGDVGGAGVTGFTGPVVVGPAAAPGAGGVSRIWTARSVAESSVGGRTAAVTSQSSPNIASRAAPTASIRRRQYTDAGSGPTGSIT